MAAEQEATGEAAVVEGGDDVAAKGVDDRGQSRSTPDEPGKQPPHASTLPFGVNLAGFLTGESGLGESARLAASTLKEAGVPLVLNNVTKSELVNAEIPPDALRDDNPYRFNVVWVNGGEADVFAAERGPRYFDGRYNIGYWVWEMADLPAEWLPRFRHFDEIWVPTRFVQDAISGKSPVPVFRTPHTISAGRAPAPARGGMRKLLDLPDDSFVFFFTFHFHGNVERKNPMALIYAFIQALSRRRDAYLVIKSAAGEGSTQLKVMQEMARGTNIRILDETMTRQQVDSLMEDCDCYVSLHRSEGYGLTMLEAMTYGKPVIATGYSGNLDFMSPQNSFLVPYKLIEVENQTGPYVPGWRWAEPDVAQAAALMRHVYENRDQARAVGLRARADVTDQLSPARVGARIRERLETITRF